MIDPQQLKLLTYWITERENIRLRKEQGLPQPWTDDAILKAWRFCNVNRCHDRETIWIFNNVIGLHEDSPVLWFNLAIARFINWSPTLTAMGYFTEWDANRFVSAIQGMRGKAYTGAYMIPAGPPGKPKDQFLADDVFTPMWLSRHVAPVVGRTCDAWDRFLQQFRCLGDFMRNQIITDIKYTRMLPRKDTHDWTTFVLPGPGTKRGLNRLHKRPLEAGFKNGEGQAMLIELRIALERHVDDTIWAYLHDLNNLSNCMCEFDKFSRVLNNEGKPRSRYVPDERPLSTCRSL